MKRAKMILVLTTLATLLALPAMADQLGAESFETTSGWTLTPAEDLTQTDGDYFGRINYAGPYPGGFSVGLGNPHGDYLFVGEDMNGPGGTLPSNATYTIELDPISIDGYNNLTVTIAANAKDIMKYDNNDHVFIYANIDNTTDVLVGAMRDDGSSGGSYNSKLGPDFNLDGTADYEVADYANMEDYTFPISGTGSSLVIKVELLFESGDEEIAFDDVRVDGDPGGPTNESDAHVVIGGVGAQATISSLLDTQPEEQIVHTCEILDAGDGGLLQNTIIDGITYVQGDANDVADWTDVIAGAELTDGVSTWMGTVNSGTIVFGGSPLLTLIDGGATVTLELMIWLRTDLPYWADNEVLEFELGPSNFATDPTGATFDMADTPVESGDLNNVIDIVGTELQFTTQPPSLVGINQNFTVRVGFTDENGGIDEDFADEDITLGVATGTGTLSAVSGLTKTSTSGQSQWYDARYDVVETGVALSAFSETYPTPISSDPFDTYAPPTITIDAYPLCWDGDNTDQAVPFAVHISIGNWAAAANQDIYLKVYESSNNPFHYTAANGWSASTSWGTKPVVTLDGNGDWSGWLALKSKGLATFKPRAALVSATGTRITGDNIVGTALDLSLEGAIVQDHNGSASAPPNEIVLARNLAGDILGMYIVEDNGYPLDSGGSLTDPGDFRFAICGVCNEDVTFETWDQATWPGNGSPTHSDVSLDFCAENGDIVELNDIILPVELASFTATAGDGSVAIAWSTASESNAGHFELLRDGALVHRADASNSPTGASYEWVDTGLENGTTYNYSLIGVDLSGNRTQLATEGATPSATEGVVTEYALHQNFPNPFNPETSIAYDLVESGFVSLKVYNLLGQEVASLVNGVMDAGRHLVTFSANELPSGVYLYRIEANGFTAQMKMVLMK